MSTNDAEQLRPYLAPQEQLRWSGHLGRLGGDDWQHVGVGLIGLALAGTLAIVTVRRALGPIEPPEATETVGEMLITLLMVACFGWFLISMLLKRRTTVYGLTTHRVLISTRRLRRRVQSLPLAAMQTDNVRLEEHGNGMGTIRFDDFASRCGEDNNQLCSPGFEWIPDAPHVFALIREAITHQQTELAGGQSATTWGWADDEPRSRPRADPPGYGRLAQMGPGRGSRSGLG